MTVRIPTLRRPTGWSAGPRPRTLLALLLVPLLVAGLLLGTAWGREKRLGRVQAAVVNSDKAVTIKGRTVPLGRQLAAEITARQDQNITWTLSDPADAAAGLASGKYAVVVTIPENFSAAATSYSSADKATQATIDVATSPAAPVEDAAIARQVATLATQSMNQSLTGGYLGNVYIGFNTMGKQLTTMANGAKQLSRGAGQLSTGVTKATDGTAQLASGLRALDANGAKLTSGATQLGSGAAQLSTGVSQYTTGVGRVVDGIGQLEGGIDQLEAGLAKGGSSAQFGQLKRLKTGAAQVAAGAAGLSSGLGAYQRQLDAWASGRQPMPQQARTAFTTRATAQCRTQVGTSVTQATSPAVQRQISQQVAAQLQQLGPQVQQIAAQLNLTPDQTRQLESQLQQAVAQQVGKVSASPQVRNAIAQQVGATICPRVTQLMLPAFQGGFQAGTATASAALQYKDPKSGQSLRSGAAALATGSAQLSAGVATLVDQLPKQVAAQTAQLRSAVSQLDAGADTLATKSLALKTGGAKLSKGAAQLSTGLATYGRGVQQYTSGVHQASTGAQQLATGMTKLDSGSSQLATGLDTFATKVSQGATKVPSYSQAERDRLSTVVAQPVTGGTSGIVTPLSQLTSLLLVLAAWLGALATWAVVRPVAADVLSSSRTSWQLFRATVAPGVLVALGQAVLLGILGAWALHLGVGRGAGLVGFLALAGLCFTAVNQALAAWWGNVGRAIALLLGVVTAAVGLVSAVPAWFTSIHALSPLAPALTGVRDIIAHRALGAGPFGTLLVVGLVAAAFGLVRVVRGRQVRPTGMRHADPASLA